MPPVSFLTHALDALKPYIVRMFARHYLLRRVTGVFFKVGVVSKFGHTISNIPSDYILRLLRFYDGLGGFGARDLVALGHYSVYIIITYIKRARDNLLAAMTISRVIPA